MITQGDIQVELERRKDELVLAKQYRLSRQLPRRSSLFMRKYNHLLVRLGELLVEWGSQLQHRFVARTAASPVQLQLALGEKQSELAIARSLHRLTGSGDVNETRVCSHYLTEPDPTELRGSYRRALALAHPAKEQCIERPVSEVA